MMGICLPYCVFLSLLIGSQCLIASSAGYTEDIDGVNSSSINRLWVSLGGLFPLSLNLNSQCGKLRNTAVERVEAMVFGIRSINENSSILPNVNFTFDIRDTCTIPRRALEHSIEYVQTNAASNSRSSVVVSGVLGAAISDASLLVANVLGLFQVPQISYGSTAAILSDKSRYDYFFRTIPPDTLQARAIASIIHHYNWTYIFALYSKDTYGSDGINSLIEELTRQNGSARVCLAVQIALPLGAAETDTAFDKAVARMSEEWVQNASVAVIFGHGEQANGMLSAVARKVDSDPDSSLDNITWIASDSWGTSLDVKFHSRAQGMLAVQPQSVAFLEFVDHFSSLIPNMTTNPWFNGYWENLFNCNLTGGGNTCAQNLPKNITLSSQYPYIINGVYAFASALDSMITDYCSNGTLCDEILVARSNGQAVNGKILRNYLLNVSLSDFSPQDLLFDRNGDVQLSYTIFNLQTDLRDMFSFRPVATWDHINLLNITRDIEWRSGNEVPQSVCSLACGPGQERELLPDQEQCCWVCRDCLGEFSVSSGDRCYECKEQFLPNPEKSDCIAVPVTYFTWSNPLGIVIIILASLGTVACIGTAVVYLVFHNNKVIKASSRELSAILLCGILFCYILSFIFLLKPSPGACAIQRLGSGLSFALVYSALLVKTNRIHRIFNRSAGKVLTPPRLISPVSQVIFTCFLALVQVLIASVWLAVEPPRVKTVPVNRKSLELVCDHSPHATLLVTILYNLILLVASTFFGFRTRKVPENFNEAKFINVTLFTLCIIWLAFVPMFYISTVELGTVYQLFFLLMTIILSASTTMCCLLIPKVFLVVIFKINGRKLDSAQSGVKSSNLTMNTSPVPPKLQGSQF